MSTTESGGAFWIAAAASSARAKCSSFSARYRSFRAAQQNVSGTGRLFAAAAAEPSKRRTALNRTEGDLNSICFVSITRSTSRSKLKARTAARRRAGLQEAGVQALACFGGFAKNPAMLRQLQAK